MMELIVHYPFQYNSFREGFDIGTFNNSTWSFKLHAKFGNSLKITRSNPSQSFAVISTFSILYKDGYGYGFREKQCYLRYIDDGEANLLFPFQLLGWSVIKEFSGSIIILQLPASPSKVPSNSLTECNPPSLKKFKPSSQLSEDFLGLLNNPDSFPDGTLKCGAEDILVHKGILSARSPVFAAMFKTEMQEGSSGVAEIVDIKPNVLQATLKYVYSGKTDHVDGGIAGDVLFAANKYQLEELKKVCVDNLKSSMTVDNVFHIVVLGDLHDEGLKMEAKKFVCKCDKFSNLQKTEGWKLFQSKYPELAMEVLMFALNYAQESLAENIASK